MGRAMRQGEGRESPREGSRSAQDESIRQGSEALGFILRLTGLYSLVS